MRRTSLFTKTLIAVALAAAGSRASAALPTTTDCTTSSTDPNCWHLKGSDTLHDIIVTAINNARTAGVVGANNLFYDGSGSGNAETQMKANAGTGAPVAGGPTLPLGAQSIGPMSRNFRPSIIDPSSSGFHAADGTTSTSTGHASWAPGCTNVLGLDAALVFTRNAGAGSHCKNINFNTFVDGALGFDPTTRAVANNTALAAVFNDGSAFNNLTPTDNYSNVFMVILSGVDGTGSLAACSDPRRVQAIQDLAACMGVSTINHLFRRDDNSGTTNTFQDRLMIVGSSADPRYPWIGGRFCNGQSIGEWNGTVLQQGICSVTRGTTCTTDASCPTGEKCFYNLNNQDLDPIRRPCSASSGTLAPTTCTDMTTGAPCALGDGNANCTQGFIVAITDVDPGKSDETTSIAGRVATDTGGQTIGYAGLEAVKAGTGTRGFTLNSIGYSAGNVRKGTYLMSRRLFLQNALVSTQPLADQPSDTATSLGITGQGADQITAEQNFFAWATVHQNIDPIVSQYNFVTCLPNSASNVCAASNNLCSTTAGPVAGALGALVPNGSVSSGGTGGAKTINSQGFVWNGTTAVAPTCTGTAACAGGTCAAGACPAFSGRSQYSACSVDADCVTGLHCVDVLGQGVPGAYLQCN
jgi:hypothetical protein